MIFSGWLPVRTEGFNKVLAKSDGTKISGARNSKLSRGT